MRLDPHGADGGADAVCRRNAPITVMMHMNLATTMIGSDMTNRRLSSPAPHLRRMAPGILALATVLGVTAATAAEPYKLTASELKLDCKRLTGTIKVRLIALRQKPIAPTTAVSRGVQSVAAPIFGGTRYGIDEDAQRAADLRLVEAYNKRLIEKSCPSFDIAAALAPGAPTSPSPTLSAKPNPATTSNPAAK